MVEGALQGCGLAYAWDRRVVRPHEDGTPIRYLDDWCEPDDGLFLYYPSRKYVSAGLGALMEMLRASLSVRKTLGFNAY